MNSTTSTSVEGVVPSLAIIIGMDRLSVDAPGTWWESVGVDPLVVYIVHQLMKLSGAPYIANRWSLSSAL